MPRKKDEKPIPPMGPGSKVVALTPQLRRHITQRMTGRKKNIKTFDVSFNTILMKKLPEEIFKNEELIQHLRHFEAPNNRIKKISADVKAWTELEHFDVHHNQLKRLAYLLNIVVLPPLQWSRLYLDLLVCQSDYIATAKPINFRLIFTKFWEN